MLRTYRRWEQARQAPQAYARTVLVNVCRERWRHRGRHPEISQDVDELANVISFAEAVDRRRVPLGLSGPAGNAPQHNPGQRPDQHTGSVTQLPYPHAGAALIIERPAAA